MNKKVQPLVDHYYDGVYKKLEFPTAKWDDMKSKLQDTRRKEQVFKFFKQKCDIYVFFFLIKNQKNAESKILFLSN